MNPVTPINPTVPVATPRVNLNVVNAEAAKVQMSSIPGELQNVRDQKAISQQSKLPRIYTCLPVFILQPVHFNNHVFNLLFDTWL